MRAAWPQNGNKGREGFEVILLTLSSLCKIDPNQRE